MGRFLFIVLPLAAVGGGYYIYKYNPDPAEVHATVETTLADLRVRLTEMVGSAQTTAEDPAPADEPVPTVESPASDNQSAPRSASSGAVGEQTLDQYRAWISEARATHPYPDSEERMYAVMMCESGGRAAVVNPAGPYSGLFQYSPATWNGDWNTYRDQDILDPRAQIFATALAWSNGMQGHWGCYSRSH